MGKGSSKGSALFEDRCFLEFPLIEAACSALTEAYVVLLVSHLYPTLV